MQEWPLGRPQRTRSIVYQRTLRRPLDNHPEIASTLLDTSCLEQWRSSFQAPVGQVRPTLANVNPTQSEFNQLLRDRAKSENKWVRKLPKLSADAWKTLRSCCVEMSWRNREAISECLSRGQCGGQWVCVCKIVGHLVASIGRLLTIITSATRYPILNSEIAQS